MCLKYNFQDAEDFVDQWMSYSASKCNGEDPTIQLLLDMERDDFRHLSNIKPVHLHLEPKLEPESFQEDSFILEPEDVMSSYGLNDKKV